MAERGNLPVADDLAASLRRVVDGGQPETLYDSQGAPVAVLVPVAESGAQTARERFLQQLRAWRQDSPEEQRREWEQLDEVIQEGLRLEPPA
jgi:antitoxin (DNA-binding transcriptional repressor) of toxin-antitoxin stability system